MALSFIQGTMRAERATVAAYKKVNKIFGGRLRITSPYGAWRSRAMQQKMYNLFLSGRGSTAARPGTSNHEGGRAVDVWNWAQFSSLQKVMKDHGFTRDASEKWHYNFTGAPAPRPAVKAVARPVLRFGSRGPSVALLQRALGLEPDSIFGAVTRARVKAFQRKYRLWADGIAGPKVWAKLSALKKL